MVSMPSVPRPEDPDSSSDDDDDDLSTSSDDDDPSACISALFNDEYGDDRLPFGRAGLSPERTVLVFLDWMTSNKVTDAAGAAAWTMVLASSPPEVKLPSYWKIKWMLRKHQDMLVRRIEVQLCMCS
jgi:hypothetical protein